MGMETAVRKVPAYAVKANDGESGSPQWKWYAASTLDTLMKGLSGRELCKEAVTMQIALIDGYYRIRDGDIDKPVYFFG
jgi:hypothetical protein